MIQYEFVMCMKKVFLIIIFILLITGCRNKDSILFKQEFEHENYSNNIKLSIPSNNPFVYITDSNLIKKIENKEDIIVLFGYAKSKETREVINHLLKISKELNINKIYYLDILEIRDEKEFNNDEINVLKQGTEEYNKIIELLKDNLNDYIINNKNVGKRIYAGELLKINDNNININNNSNRDYNSLYNFLKENNSCNPNEGC